MSGPQPIPGQREAQPTNIAMSQTLRYLGRKALSAGGSGGSSGGGVQAIWAFYGDDIYLGAPNEQGQTTWTNYTAAAREEN